MDSSEIKAKVIVSVAFKRYIEQKKLNGKKGARSQGKYKLRVKLLCGIKIIEREFIKFQFKILKVTSS